MDEKKLITRVLAGDPEAERALYDAHVDRVHRLAYRMSGDPDLARDFTQDAFVKAFGSLASFRGEAKFGTWLHAVAATTIINGLRKVKRQRSREVEMENPGEAARGVPPGRPALRVRLQRAIDKLPEILRAVVVMYELEGFRHHEIAGILGIPEGTSRARLSRARDLLRSALIEEAPSALENEWR